MSVKPLRVRQAEATRSLLVEVARQNFTEHGYAATSIDDIIQQAGVARGALYHHFSGKEALFRAVYETVESEVELVLGSAGSNRIRSALLQTVIGVVDRGLDARAAVEAPRLHFEDGVLFAEPGIELDGLDPELRTVRFGALNLFFGGVQAALRRGHELSGAGDPRRGGAALRA